GPPDEGEANARLIAAAPDLLAACIAAKEAGDLCGFPYTLVCAAIVVDAKTLQVVEKKTLTKPSPLPYIPGYTAFREGPLILELYYSLEHEPDVLMVDGEGIAHPDGGGLATYVGVELAKPTIGVSKSLLCGEIVNDDIILDGKVVGKRIKTKEHAKPLFVSPGNLIGIETAAQLCLAVVRPPHKLPEPLHIAHRVADKAVEFVGKEPLHEEPVAFTEEIHLEQ
ncbi:MAG: endonuclease V, partial [Nanoarchaeota archaeon]